MLNAHPDVFLANEAKVFVRWLPRLAKSPEGVDEATAQEILRRLATVELHYLAPLPEAEEILQDAQALAPETFFRRLFERLAAREGKQRWGEKTAVAYRQLALIRRAYPDALFIGLERDPYAIAASYRKINPKWGALGGIVHWIDFRRAVAHLGSGANYLSVSYAALVAEPEATLKAVCAFIGVEFAPGMLEYHATGRARALAADRTFEGPSRPLYRAEEPPRDLRSGLRGLLVRRLIAAAPDPGRNPGRTSLLYLLVKAWVYARALLRQGREALQSR
jgi:hypothetical protein